MTLTNAFIGFWGAMIMWQLTEREPFFWLAFIEMVLVLLLTVTGFFGKGEQGE